LLVRVEPAELVENQLHGLVEARLQRARGLAHGVRAGF